MISATPTVPAAAALTHYLQNLSALLDAHEQGGDDLYRGQGATRLPLLRETAQRHADGSCTLRLALDIREDRCLLDHVVDGRPVLPMALALEYMAQFATQQHPQWEVAEVCELRVLNGIALDASGSRELLLRGHAPQRQDQQLRCVVEILEAPRPRTCYRATLVLQAQLPPAPPAPAWPGVQGERLGHERIYEQILFHGPAFRRIVEIDALDRDGAAARVQASDPAALLSAPPSGAAWLFDPGLMDLPPQLAFIWAHVWHAAGALPTRLGRVLRYAADGPAGPLQLRWRMRPAPNGAAILYDADFVDAAGRVYLRLLDAESTMSPALSRLSPGSRQGLQA